MFLPYFILFYVFFFLPCLAVERPWLLRYNMSSRPRGICLVINNRSFKSKEKCRDGTEKDEEILRTLFTNLHFSVDVRRDLTRNRLETLMKHYGSEIDHSKYDTCY